MSESEYLQCIKVRALCIVLQDELDSMSTGNQVYKHQLKKDCKAFRVELDNQMDLLYKNLPSDVIQEYNNLANAIQEGIDEIITVCIF